MVVHDTSPKLSPYRRQQQTCGRAECLCKHGLNHTVFADLFTLRFFTFLLDLGTELTANQCQSVKMSCHLCANLSEISGGVCVRI